MPDAFMPDVQVEIAFTSGYTTPAASRTWTDVSAYVELAQGIDITFGRQDERATAGANQLTLTLDNSDGRFTAQRAASPYYPNVKIGRPIRVRVTPPGGTTVTRFVGFIDEWPVQWDGSDRYATATVRATSRMARLGLRSTLRSMLEQAILQDAPLAYWTMSDASTAPGAAESSGRAGVLLVRNSPDPSGAPVVFGSAVGPATDGLTAATFAGQLTPASQFLSGDLGGLSGVQTVRASVLVTSLPTGFDGYVFAAGNLTLSVSNTGVIRTTSVSGPSIADGRTHDVVVTNNGTTESLYVDGALVGSSAASAWSPMAGASVGYRLPGVLAHLALYATALSAPTIASQALAASSTGYSGQTTSARIALLLSWAGVAATEYVLETGADVMSQQSTEGTGVVDALRVAEATEGGVLFDGRDGNVTFHNRNHRYLASSAVTLNMAAQHVASDYLPKLDRSSLTNDVTVANPVNDTSVRLVESASITEYGVSATSLTSLSTVDLLQRATWLIASYANPRTRVPTLTVDVLAHQGLTPSAQTLLSLTIGDLLAVTNAPTQADSTSASYFVEGYAERIGPESYELTFNLSPTYLITSVLILDDATRGKLDTGLLAL